MKHIFPLIFLLIAFFISCDESSISVYNLSNDAFTSTKTDSMIVTVDKEGMPLELTGNLKLLSGECKIILTTPVIDTFYKEVPTYLYDTIYKIDSIYNVDTLYSEDPLFITDTIFVTDTAYSIESINVRDTLYRTDTIVYNDTIYQKTFNTANTYTFDEKFDRIMGNWRFYYKLTTLNKTAPEGSFDFTMKYEN